MANSAGIVIVGAGQAAATAAETLRREGFAGRLLLLGAEGERPYERPPLSKAYLTGSADRQQIYVHDPDWYGKSDVELLVHTRAAELDLPGRTVVVEDGRRFGFDKLLLATGAQPRRLPLEGGDAAGIHYLRSVEDADALRVALSTGGRRVVVVGAGWIGLEAAAAARTLGHDVTVVDPQAAPLQAALGAEMGEVFAGLHRDHNVSLRMRTGVRGFRSMGGQISGVATDAGEDLPADVVIVGVGVRPADELAIAAGLHVDNGVTVDAGLRSSHPDVYAAGDVANAYNPTLGRRLRVEHWQNARTSGDVAARSMLGQHAIHDPVPYFFTDQYDLGMEYSGHVDPAVGYDRVVIRGSVAERAFVAFWLSGSTVVAGMNVNVWDVNEAIQQLVRSAAPVDDDQLGDPDTPLDQLLPSAAS